MNARFSLKKSRSLGLFLSSCLLVVAGGVAAQSDQADTSNASTSHSYECTKVTLDYQNDPHLTREERIRLMDQALFQSLGLFDACQAERAAAAAAGGTASSAGAGEGESGQSVASTDMSGEVATEQDGVGEISAAKPVNDDEQEAKWSNPDSEKEPLNPDFLDDSDAEKAQEAEGTEASRVKHGNGKIPEDIPAADNDSVLEAQIRRAAINEQDPETRARLWNEYRKYKGLPPIESGKSAGES